MEPGSQTHRLSGARKVSGKCKGGLEERTTCHKATAKSTSSVPEHLNLSHSEHLQFYVKCLSFKY